jgi:hypothetical protein
MFTNKSMRKSFSELKTWLILMRTKTKVFIRYSIFPKRFLQPRETFIAHPSLLDPAFGYILLQGLYRVKFKPCSSKNKTLSSESFIGDDDVVCDMSNIVTSEALRLEKTSSIVSSDNWCVTSESGQHEVDGHRPKLEAVKILSCTKKFSLGRIKSLAKENGK